jgi:hypothetical protein
MIAMQMRYENVRNLSSADLIFYHLYLGPLTTIYQVIIPIMRNNLAGRMTVECGHSGIIP